MKEWKVGKLIEILKLCEPENIFNADETGLFWQLLPEKSLGFIGTKQHGDKKQDWEYCISCGKHDLKGKIAADSGGQKPKASSFQKCASYSRYLQGK